MIALKMMGKTSKALSNTLTQVTPMSLKARVITVQNLERELKHLAEGLPDFKEQMINLSDELNDIYNGIDSIQDSFENILKKNYLKRTKLN